MANNNKPDLKQEKSGVEKTQNIYFYIAIGVLVFSLALLALGFANTLMLYTFPEELFDALQVIMYYPVVQFFLGFILLIVLARYNKEKEIKVRIVKTVVGIITSPFTFVIMISGIFLLGVTSCAGSAG